MPSVKTDAPGIAEGRAVQNTVWAALWTDNVSLAAEGRTGNSDKALVEVA